MVEILNPMHNNDPKIFLKNAGKVTVWGKEFQASIIATEAGNLQPNHISSCEGF